MDPTVFPVIARQVFFRLLPIQCIMLVGLNLGLQAQNSLLPNQPVIDSIRNQILVSTDDSTKFDCMMKLCDIYSSGQLDSAMAVARSSLKLAVAADDNWMLGQVYSQFGFLFDEIARVDSSLHYNLAANKIWREQNDSTQLMGSLYNLATSYYNNGLIQEGDNALDEVILLATALKDSVFLASTHNVKGVILIDLGKIEEAIAELKISSSWSEKCNDVQQQSYTLFSLAAIYNKHGDKEASRYHVDRALDLARKTKFLAIQSWCYELMADHALSSNELLCLKYIDSAIALTRTNGMLRELTSAYTKKGDILIKLKRWTEVGKYGRKLINIGTDLQNFTVKTNGYILLGRFNLSQKQLREAEENAKLAKSLAERHYTLHTKIGAERLIFEIYKAKGQWRKALESFEYLSGLRSELSNEDNRVAAIQSSLERAYEHSKIQDSLYFRNQQMLEHARNESHARNLKLKNLKMDAVIAKQQSERTLWLTGIGVISFLGLLIYFVFREIKKINGRLHSTNGELAKSNKEINEQRLYLERKNTQITDSINYARRIQNAILPSDAKRNKILGRSFLLYEPKEALAGDFYWVQQVDDLVMFAVADCTGHGVPGAMVSVMCNSALDRSIREFNLRNPSDILNKTRSLLLKELDNGDNQVNDGMDIALGVLQGNHLTFSGANNPLWIIRNKELIELKGDKQPIGVYHAMKPFTEQTFELEPGDLLYMFSDGFADQFGWQRGKKFSVKRMKQLFLSASGLPITEQRKRLKEEFNSWMGSLEQLDDVCVLGLEV